MLRNCSLKISKFLLFICFLSLNSQLFAKEIKKCPEKIPPVGIKLTDLGKTQYKITITKSKILKDALNNQSLAEHIALLKLDAVEEFQKTISNETSLTPTKYGGNKYKEKFDNSWNTMKKNIVAMEDLEVCIDKDRIFFSGEWTTKSITTANKIVELDNLYFELGLLEMEDPEFNIDSYPFLFKTDDPKLIKEFIENWRNKRGL
tara:strand:+ start:86 stop:697 length:612 start_codon:yes stop_codon:yes gene_type:complete